MPGGRDFYTTDMFYKERLSKCNATVYDSLLRRVSTDEIHMSIDLP
jgi:hypothetical protein